MKDPFIVSRANLVPFSEETKLSDFIDSGPADAPISRRGFHARLPNVLKELGANEDNMIVPIYKSSEYDIYKFKVDNGGGRISDVTATEDRFSIHLETPVARVHGPDATGEMYRSLLNYNHDLAIGHVSVGHLNEQLTRSASSEPDGVFYATHVSKRNVPIKNLVEDFKAFNDSIVEVSRQIVKKSSLYDVPIQSLIDPGTVGRRSILPRSVLNNE